MLLIKKQKIDIDEGLKKRIDMICSFCNTKAIYECGSVRSIENTNLAYVEPHKAIIKGIVFLIFNGSDDVYIDNLKTGIKINQLESYLKKY
ncbi:MAG: hypothetical protein WC277_02865 [Bacilli bacterium]